MVSRLARTGLAGVLGSLAVALLLPAGHATAETTGTPRLNPPALWYKISGSITDEQAIAAASKYRVVILQSWFTRAAALIKQHNPAVTVLAYKDLTCASNAAAALDNERNGRPLATGVGYLEAEANGWLAKATDGSLVVWEGYPTLWQTEVWNADYRRRWLDNVIPEIVDGPFDGVFGDDALTTLRYYSDKTLAEAPTDADLAAGVGALIREASAALHANGKKLVVNIAAATDHLATWTEWSTIADGAMLEHFAHWGSDPNSPANYLWDWGSRGWTAGVTALGTSPLNVAVTTAADTDERSYRYGLASFLIATGGHGAFEAVDSYSKMPYRTEQSWDLGFATTPYTKVGAAYTRVFPKGFVAVNPSKDLTVTLAVPPGMTDAAGNPVSTLTLGPLTGSVLRQTAVAAEPAPVVSPSPAPAPSTSPSPAPAPSSSPKPAKKKWRHYTVPGVAPAVPVAAPAAPAAPAVPAAPAATRLAPAAPARTTRTPGTPARPVPPVGAAPAAAPAAVPAAASATTGAAEARPAGAVTVPVAGTETRSTGVPGEPAAAATVALAALAALVGAAARIRRTAG